MFLLPQSNVNKDWKKKNTTICNYVLQIMVWRYYPMCQIPSKELDPPPPPHECNLEAEKLY